MFWGYVSSLESNPYRYNSVLFDPLQVPTSKQGFFRRTLEFFPTGQTGDQNFGKC